MNEKYKINDELTKKLYYILNSSKISLSIQLISLVEYAAYLSAMKFTRGNQNNAAKVLGVSKGGLRNKLKEYFGTTHIGGIYDGVPITFSKKRRPLDKSSKKINGVRLV